MATSRELQKRRDEKIEEVLRLVQLLCDKAKVKYKEEHESKDVQSPKKGS
jgi:hypothetical protein